MQAKVRDHLRGLDSCGAPVAPSGMDVLVWMLNGGSRLAVRPSGTEPKLKLYALAKGETPEDTRAMAHKLALSAKQIIESIE